MSGHLDIEADTRIILHVLDCIRKGIRNIIVRSVDTDVVVLLIAYMPIILENGDIKVIAKCGVGKNLENLSINAIYQHNGLERCKQILFFHSFTGSDYTSSFFKIGKCKWWDAWLRNTDISQTFQVLSYCPPQPLQEASLRVIEQFVMNT